jgi:hypothetical protein
LFEGKGTTIGTATQMKPLPASMASRFVVASGAKRPVFERENLIISTTRTAASWNPSAVLCKKLGFEVKSLPDPPREKRLLSEERLRDIVKDSKYENVIISAPEAADDFITSVISELFKSKPSSMETYRQIFGEQKKKKVMKNPNPISFGDDDDDTKDELSSPAAPENSNDSQSATLTSAKKAADFF